MTVHVPYSQIELDIAFLGLNKKFEEPEAEAAIEEIANIFNEKVGKLQADRLKKTAEFHGITVSELINSPNMATLINMFNESQLVEMKNTIIEKLGVSDKEAWAIITYAEKS